MSSHGRSPSFDDGAATVWTAIAIAVLLVLAGMLLLLGTAAATRHKAAHAADLAALAAASHLVHGEQAACAAAGSVAKNMGVLLRRCDSRGWDALIRVELVPDGSLRWFGTARARARAGPATAERRDGSSH